MATVANGFQTETSLNELPGESAEDDHIVCGCRSAFTMCGRYFPDPAPVTFCDYKDDDCKECLKVWQTTGCGVCGCWAGWSCDPCKVRYQIFLQSTTN